MLSFTVNVFILILDDLLVNKAIFRIDMQQKLFELPQELIVSLISTIFQFEM
jgi:hypothetical protein